MVYDDPTVYQATLDHFLVIFGDFEIFRILATPCSPLDIFEISDKVLKK